MAMTNAEKQAAWRKRRQDELDTLRAAAQAAPEPAPAPKPIGPNLGPKTPLTPEEVKHLRPYLKQYREQQQRQEERSRATEEMLSKLKREHPADHAKVEEQIAAREAREARLEASKPAAGTYWWVPTFLRDGKRASEVEQIEIIHNRAGTPMWVDNGKRRKLDTTHGRWQIDGWNLFYATQEEAQRYADAMNAERSKYDKPLAGKTIEELRRIRSQNHPDKGNAHADHALYQQAVEELDMRRKAGGN